MKILEKILKIFKKKITIHEEKKSESDELNVPNLSIYEMLIESAESRDLDTIALNYFNKNITFKEFFEKIDLCARSLRSQGIRPGDVVTICLPNTPEAVISFYAINKIGAIANMLHPLSAEEEIKRSLVSTKCVLLITANFTYSKVKNIIKDTEVYKVVIVSPANSMPTFLKFGYNLTTGRKILTPRRGEDYIYWDNFMSKGKLYREEVLVKTTKEQAAVILHSGGTTGTPKNIVLTNGNINAIVEQAKMFFIDFNSSDSMLSILPLFHCFGLVVTIHVPLCIGANVILVPQFDAKKFDDLLIKYKPTVIPGVPTLFEALLTNSGMDRVDLKDIKYIISGGDTLSAAKNEEVNNFLKEHNCKCNIVQGYGMTETSGPVTFGALGHDVLGSVGIPFPGNKIKIIDVNTKETVETGKTGEICISGPTVMMGYLDNEKETNEILEKDKDNNIWVHTGDLGYVDEQGVLFFVQRLKRMLIVSGYNVYPSHIEDVIMSHELVLNCGVIGMPHPYKVQVPKAYIVLKEGVKITPKIKFEIKKYCEKNLAKYMLPKEYEFRESLPKTMLGKIDYRELEKENKDS